MERHWEEDPLKSIGPCRLCEAEGRDGTAQKGFTSIKCDNHGCGRPHWNNEKKDRGTKRIGIQSMWWDALRNTMDSTD